MPKVIVEETYRGALYEDGKFVRILGPGRHRFRGWPFSRKSRRFVFVDIRNRSLTIKGQEILTADKVAIRTSILVNFRVVGIEAALHSVASYEDRVYEDVQLSTRRILAVKTLDEILKDRNEISDGVRNDVREAAASYGVEISRADVKDLIFPGNLREIMNRVLETERQSEAMLIQARKEAEATMLRAKGEYEALETRLASDRALAEQLERSPALLRLKELEALREIAESGGNSFYIGLGDGFSHLLARQDSSPAD